MLKTKDLKDFIKNKIKVAYPNQKVSISYISRLFNSNKFNPQTPSIGVLYNNDPNGALYNMQMMQLHNKTNTLTELNRVF